MISITIDTLYGDLLAGLHMSPGYVSLPNRPPEEQKILNARRIHRK